MIFKNVVKGESNEMGFRWYGAAGDAIPLKHIRQIPGITGVVGTLLNKLPGDVWTVAEIQALKQSVEQEGLALLGIESVAIHDAIKAGTDQRDHYIDNYRQTLRNLGKCGISLVCYSFKPILVGLKRTWRMRMKMVAYRCYLIKLW